MIIQENRENWIKTLYKLRLHYFLATFLEASGLFQMNNPETLPGF